MSKQRRLGGIGFRCRLFLVLAFAVTGCTGGGGNRVELSPLAARGKQVYLSTCISCHNIDPSKDGGVGPAVSGASKELLEARILRAEYPAGYTPKRSTKVMPAMPQLKDEIEALREYLNQAK